MGELILGVYDSDEYFIVTTDGILEPLGVQVVGDSRYDLMPQTKDNTDEVPGMHGEIDFGSYYGMRALELHVAPDEGMTPQQKLQKQREMAGYLDATLGYKKLIFMDDPDVVYEVKFAGKISYEQKPTWYDFVITFKVKPFILSYTEHSQIGTGVIVNAGTFESPIFIEFHGPVTTPSISVGSNIIKYISSVVAGQTVIIDTNSQTAYISGIAPINAIHQISGNIDYMLAPQIPVSVVSSISSTIVKWNDRWL